MTGPVNRIPVTSVHPGLDQTYLKLRIASYFSPNSFARICNGLKNLGVAKGAPSRLNCYDDFERIMRNLQFTP